MAPPRRSHSALEAVRPFAVRAAPADLGRFLPSGRSLAFGFALLALAVGAYAAARTSSVFAIERIDVRGLPASDAAAARAALRPLVGRSLVGLRRAELEAPLAGLPGVRGFAYDRAFPHTLVIRAQPELALAVLRRGHESWLVSRRGRVLRRVPRGSLPALPRVWVPRRLAVGVGATLADESGGAATRALARYAGAGIAAGVRTVRTEGELTYLLRSGVELRLGSERGSELKLAVAAVILPTLEVGTEYLDVSVPSRPVAGGNPQPEG